MLLKNPRNRPFSFVKTALGFELILFGLSYMLWRGLNRSIDFRYNCYEHARFILDGYYKVNEYLDPNFNLRERDYNIWLKKGKIHH